MRFDCKNNRDAFEHVYGCPKTRSRGSNWSGLGVYRCMVLLLGACRSEPGDLAADHGSDPGNGTLQQDDQGTESRHRWPRRPESLPRWLSSPSLFMLRCVHLPTVIVLRFVVRHIAFRRQRRHLTAFLISRVVLCGTGTLNTDGTYHVSAKAMAIDSLADMGGFNGEKPIFVFGHWLGQFCAKSFYSLASTKQMFGRTQRLQIGLSDSNLSDLAEYVKVGSVSLLLDMIESGSHQKLPKLKSPLHALGRIAGDWHLVSRVATSHGEMSALEIQKKYLAAAESYVDSVPQVNEVKRPLC